MVLVLNGRRMMILYLVRELTSKFSSEVEVAIANWPNCSISRVFYRNIPHTSSWVVKMDLRALLTCLVSTPFMGFVPFMDFFFTC